MVSRLQYLLLFCLRPSLLIATAQPDGIETYENYHNEINVEDEHGDAENRNAVRLPMQRWPDRTLHYVISDEYSDDETANVRQALTYFNEHTCLSFVEVAAGDTPTDKRYISYTKAADRCGTKVGYQPMSGNGPHEVVLNPRCLTMRGVIQHETMHVLGLYHEQSRGDRGQYVQIQYDNIEPKYWSQFIAYPVMTTTFNIPYDYLSLMHYSPYAFATDRSKPTILGRAEDGSGGWVQRPMGQVIEPSANDLAKINILYKCNQ